MEATLNTNQDEFHPTTALETKVEVEFEVGIFKCSYCACCTQHTATEIAGSGYGLQLHVN
jgi:hypothetical protein